MKHLKKKLEFDFLLNDTRRTKYGVDGSTILFKQKGESVDHILLKFFTYLFAHREGIEIEYNVGQHYKPDLVKLDNFQSDPILWMECGTCAPSKIENLVKKNKHCKFWIVKGSYEGIRTYQDMTSDLNRVKYLGFKREFLENVKGEIQGRHDVIASITDESFYFKLDDREFQTEYLVLRNE